MTNINHSMSEAQKRKVSHNEQQVEEAKKLLEQVSQATSLKEMDDLIAKANQALENAII